jgi:hypothetical protein
MFILFKLTIENLFKSHKLYFRMVIFRMGMYNIIKNII